jgi:hypothetical protein
MLLYLATPHSYRNVFNAALSIGSAFQLDARRDEAGGGGHDVNLYLAGSYTRPYVYHKEHNVDLYLASPNTGSTYPRDAGSRSQRLYVLESFFYIQDWMLPYIKEHWYFLLDSGAFTFMQNKKIKPDWDEYVQRYAEFIVKNDIKLFFELDIDSVVGLKEVERLRDKLETLTNRRSIPVWHKSRGKEYWLKMATDYDYIAIGGIVSGEITKDEYKYFPALIQLAKERGAKVHGLGFTNLTGLTQYKFHSVDSTAWIYGNRSGFLQRFNGKTLEKIKAPAGMKMKSRETAIHNFNEWVKFQRYAEHHL